MLASLLRFLGSLLIAALLTKALSGRKLAEVIILEDAEVALSELFLGPLFAFSVAYE